MTRRFKKIPVWFTLSLLMALGTTPAINAGNERNALYYYRQAEHFRERGDFRAAVSNYRTSIEKNAGFPAAHLGAAQSYYELGDWSRSRAHFERVLELDRENVPARIGLGLVYVQLGQFEQARTMLMQVRSRDPGNADNNHALGVYNYRVGNQVLAEAYFQKAIRIRPAHVPALIGLARLYADQRRYPQAREYLDQARRVQPMHAAIHVTTGEVELSQAFHATSRLRRNDHLNEAGEAFLTAHQLAPDNVEIKKRLILIDMYRNRSADAIDRANELLSTNSRDPEMQYLLGTLMRMRGASGSAEAVAHIRRALELAPSDSIIRFSLEEIALNQPADYPPGGALRRSLAAYHLERANYYSSRQRRDRMRSHLRRSLQINPFQEQSLRLKLELARQEGDYEEFMRILTLLRRRNPDDLHIAHRLEQALRNRNQSLAYREELFSSEIDPSRATFERTPVPVFIFDFEPEVTFPPHPDGPAVLAEAIAFELNRPGHIQAVSRTLRDRVFQTIQRQADGMSYPYGVYYQPQYISRIEDVEDRENRVRYIITGSYLYTDEGIRLNYELIDRFTGTRVDRLLIRAGGRDAIHDLAQMVADRIATRIDVRGKIVQIKRGQIFINLGSVDGIAVGDQLKVERAGIGAGYIKIEEVSTYVSRGSAVDFNWDRLNPGDPVEPMSSAQ